MTCYGEKKVAIKHYTKVIKNSVEIMTKKLILVAKEAQQQIGETSCLWLERY